MKNEEHLRVTIEGMFTKTKDGGLEIKAGHQKVKIVAIEKIPTNTRPETQS